MVRAAHEPKLMHSRWKNTRPHRHFLFEVPTNNLSPAEASKGMRPKSYTKQTTARHECQAADLKAGHEHYHVCKWRKFCVVKSLLNMSNNEISHCCGADKRVDPANEFKFNVCE